MILGYICLIIFLIVNLILLHGNYRQYSLLQTLTTQKEQEYQQLYSELVEDVAKDKQIATDMYNKASELRLAHEEKQQKLNEQIAALQEQKFQLTSDIEVEKTKINSICQQEKNKIDQALKQYKEDYTTACQQYGDSLEQAYTKAEEEYRQKISQLEQEQHNAAAAVKELTAILTAGRAAKLREKDLELYKLQISDRNLTDVKILEDIKIKLSQPVVLSKLIWSTYFQKQATELCNRIFGTSAVCGIYKITHLKSQQVYIGQSVDCASRIKSHIKCGLGIDASATNKLYNFMQKEGVWNFSFELLEKCPKEKLDERERFWINTYQSNIIGLNTKQGNK